MSNFTQYDVIHTVLELIKVGAKSPEDNFELSGWRWIIYRVINILLIAGILAAIIYALYGN